MQLLSRGHKNEGVSTAQLRLFLDALAATGVDASDVGEPDLSDANARLRGASGLDAPRLARGLRLRDVPAMLPAAWKAARQAVAPVSDPSPAPVN